MNKQQQIIAGFYASVAKGWIPSVPIESKCKKCKRPHQPHWHLCSPCSLEEEKAPAADMTMELLKKEAEGMISEFKEENARRDS